MPQCNKASIQPSQQCETLPKNISFTTCNKFCSEACGSCIQLNLGHFTCGTSGTPTICPQTVNTIIIVVVVVLALVVGLSIYSFKQCKVWKTYKKIQDDKRNRVERLRNSNMMLVQTNRCADDRSKEQSTCSNEGISEDSKNQ